MAWWVSWVHTLANVHRNDGAFCVQWFIWCKFELLDRKYASCSINCLTDDSWKILLSCRKSLELNLHAMACLTTCIAIIKPHRMLKLILTSTYSCNRYTNSWALLSKHATRRANWIKLFKNQIMCVFYLWLLPHLHLQDSSMDILESWKKRFEDKDIAIVLNGHDGTPGGSKY